MGKGVGQTQQGLRVVHNPKSLHWRGSHPLGRRINRDKLGMFNLKLSQLVKQLVIFRVADFGAV